MSKSLRDVPRLANTADGRWEIGRGVAYRLWPLLRPTASGWRQAALARTSLATVVGSLGKTITVRCIAAALGEPEPLLPFNQFCLLALNLLAIKPWRKRAVVEVGVNRPGEMAAYAQLCRPDVVVVTSIASDHIKHMHSLDTTAREMAAMVEGLRPDGVAVLNGDDPRVLAMRTQAPRVITFGFGEHQVRCLQATLDWPRGTRLTIDVQGQRVELRSQLVGRAMVYPMLAALTVAKTMGIDGNTAARRLETIAPTAGQCNPVLSPVIPGQDEELTPEVLDAVEHSLWRRYNDRVVGDYLSPRLRETSALFLKTDAFEEALGNRRCPETVPGGMVGMDISRTVLGHARRRMPRLPLVRTDVRCLPIADGALAGVVSTSTLDHFHDSWDLDLSLEELARVLRPGGQLLLTLDNPWNPLLALRNLVPHRLRLSLKMTPYYVGCTYDPEQVVHVLDGMGFQVREVSAVLHFPRTLVGLWGVFSRKAGLARLDDPLLNLLARAELLATRRTRWLTGQYIAIHAQRKPSSD